LKFWNKVLALPDHRLPKQSLLEQYHDPRFSVEENKTWLSCCRNILLECDQENAYEGLAPCPIDLCASKLQSKDEEHWKGVVASKPKLRTYALIKEIKETESYVNMNLQPSERSLIAQTRFGILPIAIETGRFTRTPREQRLCPVCRSEIETEMHFIFECSGYTGIRDTIFPSFGHLDPAIPAQSHFHFLCNEHPRTLAKFLKKCMEIRRQFILCRPP
jgi:hypothetical protein